VWLAGGVVVLSYYGTATVSPGNAGV
jgi:hypothetical protein